MAHPEQEQAARRCTPVAGARPRTQAHLQTRFAGPGFGRSPWIVPILPLSA